MKTNDTRRCPHCGSANLDKGATGLDECNDCGGLSRDPGGDQVCRECRQPVELWRGKWRHRQVTNDSGEFKCKNKAGQWEDIEPWPATSPERTDPDNPPCGDDVRVMSFDYAGPRTNPHVLLDGEAIKFLSEFHPERLNYDTAHRGWHVEVVSMPKMTENDPTRQTRRFIVRHATVRLEVEEVTGA